MTTTAAPVGISSPTWAVIVAGFGRTRTLSLHAALGRLGFAPCEHMSNCFAPLERFALWLELARRKRAGELIDWRPLIRGCTGCPVVELTCAGDELALMVAD